MTARSVIAHNPTDTALVTTAETVVATLSGVSTPRATKVSLRGWAQLTTGVATTAVTPRVRRGVDATGTLIDEANTVTLGAAAGSTEQFEISVTDDGADLAGATYVLTLQQTAATGNGTCLEASLEAYIPE